MEMQQNATPRLDILEFAVSDESLAGEFVIVDLPRLVEAVVDTDAKLQFNLAGIGKMNGKPAIGLKIDGVLTMVCQRCLENMRFKLAIDKKLRLAATENELA